MLLGQEKGKNLSGAESIQMKCISAYISALGHLLYT